MGHSRWSDSDYTSKAAVLRSSGYSSHFVYDADVKSGKAVAKTHDKLNPFNVKVRESRDSDVHPVTNAVAILFDITGSMGRVPRELQKKLTKFHGLLQRKNYLDGPQVLMGGVGDATCDKAPLQIGQFESGIEMDDDLGNMYLEGGGGGQQTESYELAMYFMARNTSLDCFEKRGKKGYLFIIGDEMPYKTVKKREVKTILNENIQEDIPVEDIVKELQNKYEVFYIIPPGSSYYNDDRILNRWKDLLGQNAVKLDDLELVCEFIVAQIGLNEGVVDAYGVRQDLADLGTSSREIDIVTKSLVDPKNVSGSKKVMVDGDLVASGAGDGLVEL